MALFVRRLCHHNHASAPAIAFFGLTTVERIGSGGLSLRQAAKEIEIGFATLRRLLDAPIPPEATPAAHNREGSSFSPVHAKIVHHNKPVGKVARGVGGWSPCP